MTDDQDSHSMKKSFFAGTLSSKEKLDYELNSIQRTARFAGVLYLIITVAATIAHFYVPSNTIVPGDSAATVNNLMVNATLFRIGGVGGELIVLISEIILTVVLYVILRPVNRVLSLIAAIARLVMTTIHGLNLINYYFVILLLGGNFSNVFTADQLQAMVMLFLDAHSYGFTIGIAFLTIHVFILGFLIYKSGYFPKVLGIMFIAAGFGYLFDSFALLLSTTYRTTPGYIAGIIAVSEILFPLWLLIKGVNLEGWKKWMFATD